MEIENLREENMYYALAEVIYRLYIDENVHDLKYGTSTCLVFTSIEWNDETPNDIASKVDLKDKKNFVNTFMPEKPRG